MAPRRPRIALLMCDTPNPAVRAEFGTYLEIFKTLLTNSLAKYRVSDKEVGNLGNVESEFELVGFDVVGAMEYPDMSSEDEEELWDGILISGSGHSAYEDTPWIVKLVLFVQHVAAEKPKTKIIGICFGHQIVARALGSQVVKNNGVWEIGTTEVKLTDTGKGVFDTSILNIQQMHQDHVTSLPPSCELLGSTDISPVQGFIRLYPSSTVTAPFTNGTTTPLPPTTTETKPPPTPSQIQILTLQGHPEFSPRIVNHIIDARSKAGVFSPEMESEARRRAVVRDDGVGVIGRTIWRVLLNVA